VCSVDCRLTNHRVSHTPGINSKLGDRVAPEVHILITSCLCQSLQGSFLNAMRSILLDSEAAAHTHLTVGPECSKLGRENRSGVTISRNRKGTRGNRKDCERLEARATGSGTSDGMVAQFVVGRSPSKSESTQYRKGERNGLDFLPLTRPRTVNSVQVCYAQIK
jgi:hypothetical protein